MDNKYVPKENIELYCAIYKIEVFLRELIVDLLQDIDGSKWYKKRLPGDILDKYREAINFERNINWIQVTPLHPIYYIDFTDLVKIIERKDNWKDAFKGIFKKKEQISANLKELELIRNKVSHNRKANLQDYKIAEVFLNKLISMFGSSEFDKYVSKCTSEPDIFEYLTKLEVEFKGNYEKIKNALPVKELFYWYKVKDSWWFDETYLGVPLESIKNYFEVIEEYMNIPRHRGSGHIIEKWIAMKDIESIYNKTEYIFNNIKNIGWYR